MQLGVGCGVCGDFEERLENICGVSVCLILSGQPSLLLTISSKFEINPPPLKISYSLGTWISQRTLCEMSLLLTTHFARVSHSAMLLRGQLAT